MIYLKDSKLRVRGAGQIAKVFRDLLLIEDEVDRAKEHFYVMHLDTRSRVNSVELVTLGTLTSSVVHPRETFRRAVMEASAFIVIAHNHPSGEPEPSSEDTKVTKAMMEAGKLLGIDMLDHIIFTDKAYFSFRDNQQGQISVEGMESRFRETLKEGR